MARMPGSAPELQPVDARCRRPLGAMRPASMRTVVVLPAPFGPSRPKISPSPTVNDQVVNRGERAVALGEALDLDHRLVGSPCMVSFIGLRRVAGASMQAMAERTLSSSRRVRREADLGARRRGGAADGGRATARGRRASRCGGHARLGRRAAGLVRQWRHAAGGTLLEVPAGTLDPGEEPLATAAASSPRRSAWPRPTWEPGPASSPHRASAPST